MSTAALFVEAVDTAITLAHAVYGWLLFLATVAAILLLAAVACSAWAVDALLDRLCGRRRGADGPEVEPEPETAPGPPERRTGPRQPAWAHTDHHNDLEEAA